MDIREIREHFGRIKVYYLKNDTIRALGAAVMGMKGVVTSMPSPNTEVKGLIREGILSLSRDELIKSHLKTPLSYMPGQEKQLFAQLANVYKIILEEHNHEDKEAIFARKQKLDQALNLGMRLLEQHQISEADAAFMEATTHYKDEHTLWRNISKALLEKGEVRRATPYLRKCLELMPTDPESLRLLNWAKQLRAEQA